MLTPMCADQAGAALAAVVFDGPAGADGYLISRDAAAGVPFGRSAHCPIRFGHAPTPDLRLARHCGTFLVAGDRLVVESAPTGQAPIRICVDGRPPVELPPGEAYGPAATDFEVAARGEHEWVMHVRTRSRAVMTVSPGDLADPPTERRPLLLSDHERQVLEAYVAPLRAGRLEPSTHAEVAERLSYSINKTRRDLYGIWQQMVTCGVSVPEYGDKRVAVAHAALSNGLA
jgi:hypothetical protein